MGDRLLVVRPGAIGDALLAFPALAALRQARPESELLFMAHVAVGELALREGLADHFLSRDGPEADALFAESVESARRLVGAISAAVAWTNDPDGRLRGRLQALGAAPVVLAPSRPPPGAAIHVAQHLLNSLAPLGVRGYARDWAGLRFPGMAPPDRGARTLILHPGSGSPRKNWPAEYFAAVGAQLCAQLDADLAVVDGPADGDAAARLVAAATVPLRLLQDLPLLELALQLRGCDLYVGNDSGVSHLAGQSGAPTLAIFGPTDTALWSPLGRRVRTVRHEPLADLAVEQVVGAALALVRTNWR